MKFKYSLITNVFFNKNVSPKFIAYANKNQDPNLLTNLQQANCTTIPFQDLKKKSSN